MACRRKRLRHNVDMVAFQVVRNGRSVCIAGLRGKPGVVSTILHWADRQGGDEIRLQVGGLDSATQEHLIWANRSLQIDDEVIVRVVENARTTRVRSREKRDDKAAQAQEKKWLRATAKKYGYELVKS